MYRAGLEWILGFRLRGALLHLDPCIPRSWPGFELTFLYHSARYQVRVQNPHGVTRGIARVEVDGAAETMRDGTIPLADDGVEHLVVVTLGAPAEAG
jgi:cyclic beta-1,2-glucan synthetase